MIAFQRTPAGPRVRSGIEFPDGQWVLVEEPPESLLNDPGFRQLEVSGHDDPKLANLSVTTPEEAPTPDPEKEPSQEEITAYLNDHDLSILPKKELDALNGERDRLEAEVTKLKGDLQNVEADRDSLNERHKEALAKVKADLADVKGQLAEAKKGK